MARLILISSEYTDSSQVGESHFGREKWYVLMNESGDVELAISSDPFTSEFEEGKGISLWKNWIQLF